MTIVDIRGEGEESFSDELPDCGDGDAQHGPNHSLFEAFDNPDDTVTEALQESENERLIQELFVKFQNVVGQYLQTLDVEDAEQTKFDTTTGVLTSTDQNTLQAIGMNVRGLNSNRLELEDLFRGKDLKNVIIFLSEIFEPSLDLDLEGMQTFYLTRPKKQKARRGGVGLLVHRKLGGMKIDALCHMMEGGSIECLTVRLPDQRIICMSIYRPIGADYVVRNTFEDFLEKISQLVERARRMYPLDRILLIGDFNVDLLDMNADSAQRLTAELAGCGLTNYIHAPTRICDTTATLIDHCWTDMKCTTARVLIDGIADHYGIYAKLPTELEVEEIGQKWSRKLNGANLRRIKKKLRKTDWSFINSALGVEEKWRIYEEKISKVINEVAPQKKIKEKEKQDPWYTKHLRTMKRKMDQWQLRMREDPMRQCQNGKTTKQNFAYHRNRYKRALRKAKADHWETLFLTTTDSKKVWKLINKCMQREETDEGIKTLLREDGTFETSAVGNATIMNEFFANIGEKTAQKIPATNKDPMSYLNYLDDESTPKPTFTRFSLCDQEEVERVIKSMKPKANVMSNGINMKIVRECRKVLSPTLTTLLNESITKNVFPEQLKIAEVVPLYKKGQKEQPTNYRPISLLDPFSKVYEKILEGQLRTYMETNRLLTKNQHGYRMQHSCDSMIISFLQEMSDSLQAGDISVVLMLDCSKAFDSISRPLLLKKLEKYGLRNGALELVASYLTDRNQRVKIDQAYSELLPCATGVPQGSIFGPLLYIIYTNDVDIAIDSWSSLYADDNNSSHRAKELDTAMDGAQRSLTRTENGSEATKSV